jgi:hypothetical protein
VKNTSRLNWACPSRSSHFAVLIRKFMECQARSYYPDRIFLLVFHFSVLISFDWCLSDSSHRSEFTMISSYCADRGLANATCVGYVRAFKKVQSILCMNIDDPII